MKKITSYYFSSNERINLIKLFKSFDLKPFEMNNFDYFIPKFIYFKSKFVFDLVVKFEISFQTQK
jgi:hypothetical protein